MSDVTFDTPVPGPQYGTVKFSSFIKGIWYGVTTCRKEDLEAEQERVRQLLEPHAQYVTPVKTSWGHVEEAAKLRDGYAVGYDRIVFANGLRNRYFEQWLSDNGVKYSLEGIVYTINRRKL